MKITESLLRKLFTGADEAQIKTYAKAMSINFPLYEISTSRRIAALLAQIAVDTNELKDISEPNEVIEDKDKALGNYVKGDGKKYIKRGLITQMKGRNAYTKFGNKIKIDLVKYPDRALEPNNAVKIACENWKQLELNKYADLWNGNEIAKRIAGKEVKDSEKRNQLMQEFLKLLETK